MRQCHAATRVPFLRDFAGDLPEAKAKVLYAVQEPFHKALLVGSTTHAAWRSEATHSATSKRGVPTKSQLGCTIIVSAINHQRHIGTCVGAQRANSSIDTET
jgi:hypothetical protein